MSGKQWRPCPVEGCDRKRRNNQVVCRRCWWFVEKELRERIWRLFRSDETRGGREHQAALIEAVRICSAQLAKQHKFQKRQSHGDARDHA
ncbi:MAG: hypothetical protein AAF790_09075 [Planctomycetota bacterium]